MRTAIAGVVILAASVAAADDEWQERAFPQPKAAVYQAMLEVAAKDFNIRETDKDSCVLAFSTGMSMKTWKGHDVSALCIEQPDGGTKVILHDQRKGSQAVTWGAGKGARKKFLTKLAEKLKSVPAAPATPAPTTPAPASPQPSPAPEPTPHPQSAGALPELPRGP